MPEDTYAFEEAFCERCGQDLWDSRRGTEICGTCIGERERRMWSEADMQKWPYIITRIETKGDVINVEVLHNPLFPIGVVKEFNPSAFQRESARIYEMSEESCEDFSKKVMKSAYPSLFGPDGELPWLDLKPAPKDLFYREVMGGPPPIDNPCPRCECQLREHKRRYRCDNPECNWRPPRR